MSRAPVANAAALAADIERLPEVASVARVRMDPGMATSKSGVQVEVYLIGTTRTGSRVAWTLAQGADLPIESIQTERCPVVVGRRLATAFDLQPGSMLRLRASDIARSALPDMTCQVVGIGDSLFSTADSYDVLTTLEGLRQIKGGVSDDAVDVVLVASRPEAGPAAAVSAITKLRRDIGVYSNEDVLMQFNQNGFAYFRQISVVLSSITIVFTFLLVATILTVSTNQRLGEIAALRALGIGRPRIAAMLLWESALIVGGGGLLALPLGGLVASGLDRILKQMPGVPEALHFFVFGTSALALHLTLLSVTAVIAAAYPIWLTARLPIAATLRREVVG
jgi:putative ABC transport system permease protein